MTVNLSRDSFISLLTKSGLIKAAALSALVAEYQSEGGTGSEDGELFAQFLVRKGELTTWQAKKLLQGKHKGFLLGKYRLLSLLGRGGMSSVYLAEHVTMRRRCAIKVLPTKHVNDAAALDRFYQEAQAVAALDDPHIVRAYDVDQVLEGKTEIHFLVMEYVQGRSLQEVVDQDGPLPLNDAIDYICQAASGLDHAHQAGMVHRDIKPSNLLLDSSGTVKVLDMGLARFFEQTDQQSLTLQHDQRVLGTADYLSPEQAVDSHTVDTRSDIYSLGGTLYFLLCGHPPFPDGTLAQRLLAHQTKKPKSITRQRPDVPASFARILEGMMAKVPDGRPGSAGEVRRALRDWLDQNGAAFARATVPPVASPLPKPADPTAAGWSDFPELETLVTPADKTGTNPTPPDDSNVISDPNLGQFLSALSTDVDPAKTDSERLSGAKTVVSGSRPDVVSDDFPTVAVGQSPGSDIHDFGNAPNVTDSGSHVRRRKTPKVPTPVLAAGAGGLLLCAVLYFFWARSGGLDAELGPAGDGEAGAAIVSNGGALTTDMDEHVRPPVDPGSDITVGPEGNFGTINEAIAWAREHFQPLNRSSQCTIRVTGGVTYPESIEIDNSSFGTFPQGVSIICEGAGPAVLAPGGRNPIITLVNVDRFRLEGFHLQAQGRPVAMRLGGYLVRSRFENLSIDNVGSTAIEAVGVSGLNRSPVVFRNLLIHDVSPDAVGIAFAADGGSTKDVLLQNCRFAGPMRTGVSFEGEVAQLQLNECRFDQVNTPIRFLSAERLDYVMLVNNTFREFDQAVLFSSMPAIDRHGVGFLKNLFAGVRGPEVKVAGTAGVVPLESIVGQAGARFNWSEGAAMPADGSLDIFQADGRRGVEPLTFTSTDPEQNADFLKPRNPELRQAARAAPNPKFIGAVAPAGVND